MLPEEVKDRASGAQDPSLVPHHDGRSDPGRAHEAAIITHREGAPDEGEPDELTGIGDLQVAGDYKDTSDSLHRDHEGPFDYPHLAGSFGCHSPFSPGGQLPPPEEPEGGPVRRRGVPFVS